MNQLEFAVHYLNEEGQPSVQGPFYTERETRLWIEKNMKPSQFLKVSFAVRHKTVLGSLKAEIPVPARLKPS